MKTMGERIKDLRSALKMSQQQVAEALTRMGYPISQRGLSKLERGQSIDPKSDTVRGLVKFYQVDLDWLVTGKGQQNAVSSLHPDESELILLFRSLSPSGRAYVLGRAREVHRDEHEKRGQDSNGPDGPSTNPPTRPAH